MTNEQKQTLKEAVYKLSDARWIIEELNSQIEDTNIAELLANLKTITSESKGNAGQYLREL